METPSASETFEIIVGTYEEFVLGFAFQADSKKLTETFAIHSHRGSVRCIAACDAFVASGGSDELIQLYDLTSRRAIGSIMQHTGTVTSLKFTPEKHHLISCSEDGSVAIFRKGTWQMEKIWTSAHKGAAVSCIDIHPSSKLALSLGQNRTLRTWNLIKGRPAFTSNLSSLGKSLDSVNWSQQGSFYAIIADTKIQIFDVTIAGIIATVECLSRINCLCFVEDDILCFGTGTGSVNCYCITSKSNLWTIQAGDCRVKSVSSVSSKWFVTAHSDGLITVWQIANIRDEPLLLASINIGSRITCMTIRLPAEIKSC